MTGRGQQSPISRMVRISIAISLLVVLFFMCVTLALQGVIRAKNEARISLAADAFGEMFEAETEHLRDAVALCKTSGSFIMLTSGMLEDVREIKNYTLTAMNQLSIIGSSLPHVVGVLLVSSELDRVVSANGSSDLETFLNGEWLRQYLDAGEEKLDFGKLTPGWHLMNNFALYTQAIYNGGILVAVVRHQYIADINTYAKYHPGYQMIVLDANGEYFTSSVAAQQRALAQMPLCALASGDIFSFGNDGVRYRVHRMDTKDFSYLLLADEAGMSSEYLMLRALLAVSVLGAVLILLVIITNARFLRRIQRIISRRHVPTDELEHISQIVEAHDAYLAQEAARFLREADAGGGMMLPAVVANALQEEIGGFSAFCVAFSQSDGPISGEAVERFSHFLRDHCALLGTTLDEWRACYLIERGVNATKLRAILEQFRNSLPGGVCIWGGLSDPCEHSAQARAAISQAGRRMVLGGVSEARPLALVARDEDAGEIVPEDAQIAEFVGAALEANWNAARDALRVIFPDDPPRSLASLRSLGMAIFDEMTTRAVGILAGGELPDFDLDVREMYHPALFSARLLSYAQRLCERIQAANAVPNRRQADIVEWLDAHYAENLSLESVAEAFSMNPMYLSRWFKKNMEVNFLTYLSDLRVRKACALLGEQPFLKNQELAEATGYVSAVTFGRHFKQQTGLTPDQYRRRLRTEPLSEGEGEGDAEDASRE